MATQKQIEANRLNAQKSTGPRSPEAKAKTRLNAKRDGITGQIITLSDEDRPFFEARQNRLIADLQPETATEFALASSIAWDTWRLDHLRAVETNIYAQGVADSEYDLEISADPQFHIAMSHARTYQNEAKRFNLMSLYDQRLNRAIHKNLDALRKLQTERKRIYDHDLAEETAIAQANAANGLPYEAPAHPNQNGIVFSTPQIMLAANRKCLLDAAKRAAKEMKTIPFPVAWNTYHESSHEKQPASERTTAAAA